MKKKTPPRLTLKRETIRNLEQLGNRIVGGFTDPGRFSTQSKDLGPCHDTDFCYY